MKKLIVALIALSMLLSCLPGLADGAPIAFEDAGINIDFEDVLDASVNLEEMASDICNRDPFVACVSLSYYALPEDILYDLNARFMEGGEEERGRIRSIVRDCYADIAYVVVTDAPNLDDAIGFVLEGIPEDMESIELGEVDAYRYVVVLPSVKKMTVDYEALGEFGIDGEAVRKIEEEHPEDMEQVRAAFVERLKAAELYAPIDPLAGFVGQTLSFETTDVDGNAVTSADLFADKRITMVNLWGMWCINCVNEMEELAEMQTRLQEKGCGIVGIEWEKEPIDTMVDDIHAFMEEKGMNYPSVIMPVDNDIFNQVTGFPTTFFVDDTGRILTVPIVGAYVDAYERTVDRLLAGEEVDMAADAGAATNDGGEYRVIVCDRDGDPVEGVVIQFCDDVICSFQETDADGIAAFSVEEQKVYDVHVLTVPEGYAPDEGEYKTPDTFSDVSIFLDKAA